MRRNFDPSQLYNALPELSPVESLAIATIYRADARCPGYQNTVFRGRDETRGADHYASDEKSQTRTLQGFGN